MGADLYIESRFTSNYARWSKRFDKAVARRDTAVAGSDEAQRAARAVNRYYERMHRDGYFRDSYNPSNLLWQFGLSWWEDVIPMLNENSELSPSRAEELLSMLESKLSDFEERIGSYSADDQRYFRKKWRQLRHFLTTAIAQNEPIACSL